MIILDTNVFSEPLRSRPDSAVLGWLADSQGNVMLTSVSVGEILTAVNLLPDGRRRDGLAGAVETTLANFADRILPYDASAARRYAHLRASRRSAGQPLSVEDGMIAAICLDHGATLATRNVKDFRGLGVELIDPWQ